MKDYTEASREPPAEVEEKGKQHWSKRVVIALLLGLMTLLLIPKKWRTMLAAHATTMPFWTGWFVSDKVTWAQATAAFKGTEIAAWWGKHMTPVLTKVWDAVTDLWALFTNGT